MPIKIAQFVELIRSTKREMKLDPVIFFVTSRCNAFALSGARAVALFTILCGIQDARF